MCKKFDTPPQKAGEVVRATHGRRRAPMDGPEQRLPRLPGGLSCPVQTFAALPENGLQGGKMPQPPASHEKTKKNCKNLLTEGLVLGIVSFDEGL